MSETRDNLVALVSEKLTALKGKIAEAGTTDEKFAIYDKYTLFFDGVAAGLTATGATEEESKPVTVAVAHINAELDLLELLG